MRIFRTLRSLLILLTLRTLRMTYGCRQQPHRECVKSAKSVQCAKRTHCRRHPDTIFADDAALSAKSQW